MSETVLPGPILLKPEWPRPRGVELRLSTRAFGQSIGKYAALNLGNHVEDDPLSVMQNRALVRAELPAEPNWLNQVHGSHVVEIDSDAVALSVPDADASFTKIVNQVLVVMVADCLPIALVSGDGQELAVVHAGWRGLANGVLAEAVKRFDADDIYAWLGPAIGPCHYEVDKVVRNEFSDSTGFVEGRDKQHWMMDLSGIAARQLNRLGIKLITNSRICTVCDHRFFSHRDAAPTGRFGIFLWKSA